MARASLFGTLRRGFTLIEILVSVAIISFLAVLLAGSVSILTARAASAGCLSNMRQIGAAMAGYAAENSGCLPLAEDKASQSAAWMTVLCDEGFLPPMPAAQAQRNAIKHPLFDPGTRVKGKKDPLRGHYGINRQMVGPSPTSQPNPVKTRVSVVSNGSKKILVFCSGYYAVTLPQLKTLMQPSGYLPGASRNASGAWEERYEIDAVDGRHAGKIHVLFLGGNVDSLRPDDILDDTTAWQK